MSYNQLDETTAQINALLKSSQEDLNCGPDCQKQKTSQQLQSEYIDAKNNMLSAPYKLKDAQKAYITYVDGDASYNSVIKQELMAEANKEVNKMRDEFNKSIKNAYEKDREYEALYDNYFNIRDLLQKYVSQNDNLRNKLETEKDDTITNDRKTFYENQHLNVVSRRFLILKWIYGILFTLLVLFIFIKENDYSMPFRFFIVLILLF
jgi:predicted  nucleic acid-binding Zn-ribbon protein